MISSLESAGSFSLKPIPTSFVEGQWPTALAPMQDVTSLPFMKVVASRGAPDFFFTEFFRVHASSKIDSNILSSITENPTDRPVFAQLIGENVEDLRRTVREFKKFPIAGIDLNLGCPAPRVFRKNVGGGLLRVPDKVKEILKMLRYEVGSLLTVKMRIGFEDDRFFSELLEAINMYGVELLSLHARTVLGGYRSDPSYSHISTAAKVVKCPVMLNGNVTSASSALRLREETGAYGVMVGRSAIRNPWIFRQIRESQKGGTIYRPKMEDVFEYIVDLYEALEKPEIEERKSVARMKKFLNFVGLSVDSKGLFLHQMRRVQTKTELFGVCTEHLIRGGLGTRIFNDEPFDGLIARPSSEAKESCQI